MIKTIICAILQVGTTSLFGQKICSKQPLTHEDYLKKSNFRKAEGWLLLFGGAAVITITGMTDPGFIFPDSPSPIVPVSIGAAMMVGSIPLFIRSGRNKSKAMIVSLKNGTGLRFQDSTIVYSSVPALSLKVKW